MLLPDLRASLRTAVLLAWALMGCFLASPAMALTVVGADDGEPLIGATAFSRNGAIIGLTDGSGRLDGVSREDYPLTVRCLGYDDLSAAAPSDTLRLSPRLYELREVAVTPADRPVRRVVGYAREYTSATTDTVSIRMMSEYMLDMFLTDGKVKGVSGNDRHARRLNVRRYARYTDNAGLDSVAAPGDDDDMFSLVEIIVSLPYRFTPPESIRSGSTRADTVMGKYCPEKVCRLSDRLMSVSLDMLADKKNHTWSPWVFKLFGLTVDIQMMQSSIAYTAVPTHTYELYDLVNSTHYARFLGRGRWIKKALKTRNPVEFDCFIEFYPIEITNLTVDEYKSLMKSPPATEFVRPSSAPTLPGSYGDIVERVNALSRNSGQ